MSKFVSPNDLHKAAKTQMLQGKEPVSQMDWMLCANFWAANIASGMEVEVVKLMGLIFQCPLTTDVLTEIAQFQVGKKEER